MIACWNRIRPGLVDGFGEGGLAVGLTSAEMVGKLNWKEVKLKLYLLVSGVAKLNVSTL